MNFEKVLKKKRQAISPVLATVILIAITLIAAVAIATFVFGIFGSSASPAQLSIVSSTVSCTATGCTMSVTNGGTAGGSIVSAGPSGNFTLSATVAIPSNGAGAVTLTWSGTAPAAGTTISGYLVPNSGANLYFTTVVT